LIKKIHQTPHFYSFSHLKTRTNSCIFN